jgi:hypothetical protein
MKTKQMMALLENKHAKVGDPNMGCPPPAHHPTMHF